MIRAGPLLVCSIMYGSPDFCEGGFSVCVAISDNNSGHLYALVAALPFQGFPRNTQRTCLAEKVLKCIPIRSFGVGALRGSRL